MKLYATTTSERASKGQGGNKQILIDLLCGSATNQLDAGHIEMEYKTLNGSLNEYDIVEVRYYKTMNGYIVLNEIKIPKSKGKQKKDEVCLHNYCNDERQCNACGKQL